jgi:hypothetical protein
MTALAQHEALSNTCRLGSAQLDDRIVGIMRDTIRERWIKPRLAWMFDTLSVRIKTIPVNSVFCILKMPD